MHVAGDTLILGAPLARLEAEVAFEALLRRYPVLELADPAPRWRPMIKLRGLQSLHLRGCRSGGGAAYAADHAADPAADHAADPAANHA